MYMHDKKLQHTMDHFTFCLVFFWEQRLRRQLNLKTQLWSLEPLNYLAHAKSTDKFRQWSLSTNIGLSYSVKPKFGQSDSWVQTEK